MKNASEHYTICCSRKPGRVFSLVIVLLISGCDPRHRTQSEQRVNRVKSVERLAGEVNVHPAADVLEKGRVLMSYSDCFACHKESERKLGPAFSDIAARYPMNSTYIQVLSKRIILGSRGSWGNTVMPPHPKLSDGDAATMVMYILSLDGPD